jgi:hypothetical protein
MIVFERFQSFKNNCTTAAGKKKSTSGSSLRIFDNND